ncbi:MAG TPA: PstS family phosphate ABC transporter substrate-binding protein [Dehalococcoidia bacterium]|nr:PstS family phosphate ABC transporter substrate-binding protein [Dehalococcoidia bacterium]
MVALVAACGSQGDSSRLSGRIIVDGSSTVFPISEAVAEEFRREEPGVEVVVGISGTGGGFQKFCNGETDISDASRPIRQQEIDACRNNGIDFIELPVAFDALSVVVNPANDWVDCITVAELKKMWEPAAQGTITRWSQVNPAWPDRPLRLYGAGTDSGTFDYFTEAIVGKEDASRGDYTASEDDNVLVQGVAGDPNALGYFGLAYYLENRSRLKALKVDGGQGCVEPSVENVINGTYRPLSRPLFIYVSARSAERPEVQAFVDFYLETAADLAREVGYVPLPSTAYDLVRERWQARRTGTVFQGVTPGLRIEDVLTRER